MDLTGGHDPPTITGPGPESKNAGPSPVDRSCLMTDLYTASTIAEVRRLVAGARREGRTIGLVPTMGALHAGHQRLVEEARRASGFVIVSIFVNPTQFGPSEDFRRYPRTIEADAELCARGGANLIFAPEVEAMYPRGASSTFVEVPALSETLEGASRSGHFRGVATVVLKLFTIVGPDLAFFGTKDYQQLRVIRRMVEDLDIPVDVRAVSTVHEPDGLALSSRNRYLDPDHRAAAVILSKALAAAIGAVEGGERDAGRVRQILRDSVGSEPLAGLDYAEVADAETLEPALEVGPGHRTVALLAARVGPARLIDNAPCPLEAVGPTDRTGTPRHRMRQILFEVGGVKVFGYGLMLFFAFLGSMNLAAWRARREKLDPEVVYDLALWVFIGGLVGARGFYVAQYWGVRVHSFWEVFEIWKGGIVLYGSILGGTLAFLTYRLFRPFRSARCSTWSRPRSRWGSRSGGWAASSTVAASATSATSPGPCRSRCTPPRGRPRSIAA